MVFLIEENEHGGFFVTKDGIKVRDYFISYFTAKSYIKYIEHKLKKGTYRIVKDNDKFIIINRLTGENFDDIKYAHYRDCFEVFENI